MATTALPMTRWRLWIGGSSGLAQTYCAAYPNDGPWIWLGSEPVAPRWILNLQQQEREAQKQQLRMANAQVPSNTANGSTIGTTPFVPSSHYISCDLVKLSTEHYASHFARNVVDRIVAAILASLSYQQAIGIPSAESATTSQNGCKKQQHGSIPLSLIEVGVVKNALDQIIVGVRPPLVTSSSHRAAERHGQALRHGLQLLLQAVLTRFNSVQFILHISSIAAVHHIQEQRLQSWTAETDPSSESLHQPYDRFKRGCEELIAHVATEHNIRHHTSLRLGAIFSDAPTCIQCNALALQCYTGPYLPVRIDCNSSRNASHMIHLLLHQERPEQLKNGSSSGSSTGDHNAVPEPKPVLRPVYYYTRCVSQYPDPVPYGEFLLAYFQANHDSNGRATLLSSALARWCRRCVWLPHWLVLYGFVLPFRWCTMVLTTLVSSKLPYIESIDYLLQGTVNEHSFDLTDTVRDFPDIVKLEETMQECFARRRRMMLDRK